MRNFVASLVILASTALLSCVPKEEPAKPAAAPAPAAPPPEPARAAFTAKPDVTYAVVGAPSNKCLQAVGAAMEPALTEIRACNNSPAQQFKIQPVAGGYITLVNVHSNKCLDVTQAGMQDGASIITFDCHGGQNQQFIVADGLDGTFRLVARHSGKVFDVAGEATLDGTLVGQWTWKSSSNQTWKLTPVGGVPPVAARDGGAPAGKDTGRPAKGKKNKEAAKEAVKDAAKAPAAPKP